MSTTHNYFDNCKFSPLGEPAAFVMSALNMGRTDGIGTCSIHAGPKGYSMKICNKVVARGSTPDELLKNFRRAQAKAKARIWPKPSGFDAKHLLPLGG